MSCGSGVSGESVGGSGARLSSLVVAWALLGGMSSVAERVGVRQDRGVAAAAAAAAVVCPASLRFSVHEDQLASRILVLRRWRVGGHGDQHQSADRACCVASTARLAAAGCHAGRPEERRPSVYEDRGTGTQDLLHEVLGTAAPAVRTRWP